LLFNVISRQFLELFELVPLTYNIYECDEVIAYVDCL